MSQAILRRKPRIVLNIPAYLKIGDAKPLPCCIVNASIEGFGIGLSTADFEAVQKNLPKTCELIWAPVPSMPHERWSAIVRRLQDNTLGVEVQKNRISPRNLKVLQRLIHFHLG